MQSKLAIGPIWVHMKNGFALDRELVCGGKSKSKSHYGYIKSNLLAMIFNSSIFHYFMILLRTPHPAAAARAPAIMCIRSDRMISTTTNSSNAFVAGSGSGAVRRLNVTPIEYIRIYILISMLFTYISQTYVDVLPCVQIKRTCIAFYKLLWLLSRPPRVRCARLDTENYFCSEQIGLKTHKRPRPIGGD